MKDDVIEWRSRVKVMQRSLNHHLACQPWCCLHPSDVRVSLSSRHWQRVNILNWKRRELARWSFKSKLNDFIYCHVDRQVWEEKRKSFPHFISLMTFNPPLIPSQLLFAFNDREACKNFLVNIKIIDDASLRLWIYTANLANFSPSQACGREGVKNGTRFHFACGRAHCG